MTPEIVDHIFLWIAGILFVMFMVGVFDRQ